ncbi:peroxidase family protein [Nocardia sp. NPDC051570]|uniref:peroxidase family protein n=1 Tax=Nocardia sp. NPDC051570 TaxID=3364324 RepID=UPI0037BD23C3
MKARSMTTDGAANRLRYLALTNGKPAWDLAQRIAPVRETLNTFLIDSAIREMPPRPEPLSTMASYTSWSSLTDRTYSGRHLPPIADAETGRPSVKATEPLFTRDNGMIPCRRSTVMFAYFAQWFTDGFLRSDSHVPPDPRKNSSNHSIDLNQLYGLNDDATNQLRAFEGGRLKSQSVNGGEFPPYLCEQGKIKQEFSALSVVHWNELSKAQRDTLFAVGSDRGNSQIGFTMLTVLFLREHNRLARVLAEENPAWDDERLFQTTRNVMILLLLKLVVDEYINHITPYHFQFKLTPKLSRDVAEAPWQRQNWASVEFNLVYRWHSLIPSALVVGGREIPVTQTLYAGPLLPKAGLARTFEEASRQGAGQIGLFNTDASLVPTDLASIARSRTLRLAPYNAYRKHLKMRPVHDFRQISSDARVNGALHELYRSVDDVDLYVGLFAEEGGSDQAILGPLLTKIIAIDAFSQALTNPLVAPRILHTETFSPAGMQVIENTRTVSDILHRNTPEDLQPRLVTMTRRDAQ